MCCTYEFQTFFIQEITYLFTGLVPYSTKSLVMISLSLYLKLNHSFAPQVIEKLYKVAKNDLAFRPTFIRPILLTSSPFS